MQKISSTRLAGALALGAFGFLAACSPKEDVTADTLATTPPATATTPKPSRVCLCHVKTEASRGSTTS
jgi:hypothetical protein